MTPTAFPHLDAALTALSDVSTNLTEEELVGPTPCSKWTVTQVLLHAAGDQVGYAATLDGGAFPADDPFTPAEHSSVPVGEVVAAGVSRSSQAFAPVDPRGDAVPVPLPGPDLPPQIAAGACALDAAVHAWDVAVATGRPSPLTDEMSEWLMAAAVEIVEPVRAYGMYAAALEPVAEDGAADRLLRYLGRDPGWRRS
jgi:uncharacterized protein (TIGR03086 family)